MTDYERMQIMIIADTIKGEINRMCVTDNLSELDFVYSTTEKNLDILSQLIRDCRFENKVKMNKWVPVNEKLPFTDVNVLVNDGVNMFVAWWDGDDWHSFDDNFRRDSHILAWQSLPEPYYEEGEENNE